MTWSNYQSPNAQNYGIPISIKQVSNPIESSW